MRYQLFGAIAAMALVTVCPAPASAVCPRTLTDKELAAPLTGNERFRVVTALASMAQQFYVNPAKGEQISEALRRNNEHGRYNGITDPADFAKALAEDMRAIVPDKHLQVRVQRIEAGAAPATAGKDTPEAQQARKQRFLRSAKYDGYGIREAKLLPGNIGYLSLGEFWTPDVAGGALKAAMSLLKDSDALIIDLRGSYGGHEDVILLLMGHLLDRSQPIFTSVDRLTSKTNIGVSAQIPAEFRLKGEAPVYVLTSRRRTFSAAEALTLALKRKRGALQVGEPTRGGANGGDFRPLSCRFDAFVPYFGSSVDGISWEGSGIAPDIGVPETDALDLAYRHALSALVGRPARPDEDSLDREIREERQELLKATSQRN